MESAGLHAARFAAGFIKVSAALVLVLALAPSVSAQSVRSHVVRPGETLYRIATTYGLSVADLKRLNDLTSNTIRAGQRLLVEAPPPATPDAQPPPPPVPVMTPPPATQGAPAAPPATLTPSASESVYDIAFRYGITPDTLFALNPDLPTTFGGSAVLRVPEELAMRTYRVRRGDTLFRIATNHGTTAAAIRAANRLVSDQVNIGQDLLIPGSVGAGPSRARRTPAGQAGLPPIAEQGTVAVYPSRFAGRLMSGGEPYDPGRFTVAHSALALGTIILITNTANGRSTFAEVADRMPGGTGRILEVSAAVAGAITLTDRPVAVRIIDLPR